MAEITISGSLNYDLPENGFDQLPYATLYLDGTIDDGSLTVDDATLIVSGDITFVGAATSSDVPMIPQLRTGDASVHVIGREQIITTGTLYGGDTEVSPVESVLEKVSVRRFF